MVRLGKNMNMESMNEKQLKIVADWLQPKLGSCILCKTIKWNKPEYVKISFMFNPNPTADYAKNAVFTSCSNCGNILLIEPPLEVVRLLTELR